MIYVGIKVISCGDLHEQKRPDRGDPDGGDSENGDGSCEKNDQDSTKPTTQGQSEASKHPTFNLPSPFKTIDLRTVFKIHPMYGILHVSLQF